MQTVRRYNRVAQHRRGGGQGLEQEEIRRVNRKEILSRAEQVICGGRQDVHGDAENSFADIANLWAMYLNGDVMLENSDVACMMILLKVARAKANPLHMDNWIDICGYAAIGAEMACEERENEEK